MKFLPLLWSNLKRRKLRTILTIASILVAFLLYALLCAISNAFNQGIEVAGADRLVVRHKVSIIQLLPRNYGDRIARIPGVKDVMHSTWFGGIYQDPKNFFGQFPVDPDALCRLYPEFLLTDQAKAAWNETRTGAIVGKKTADKFGWKVGDRIPIQATIWPKPGGHQTWEFDIVGIFDAAEKGVDTTAMYFRYDYFDEARAYGKGQVGWYIIRVDNPDDAAVVATKIDEEFANSAAETKAETEKAFVQAFAKQIGDIGAIMVAILSAVFFTILLVAGNTMAQSVRERAEEIGVLKAMGFTNRRVLLLVLAESCFLAGLAGLLGLGSGWLLISAGDPTGGALPVFYFPTNRLLLGVGLIVALGIAAGVLPAWQAMRLRIADALRRV